MRVSLASLLASFFVALFTGSAAQATPASLCIQPIAAKHAVTVYRAAAQDGIITKSQADDGVRKCLQQLSKKGYSYSENQLLTMSESAPPPAPKLTALQRFAGMITFINVLLVIAILAFVAAFCYFFRAVIKLVIKAFEPIAPLALGIFSLVMFFVASRSDGPSRPYLALLSCLLFGAAILLSRQHLTVFQDWMVLSLVLFVVWSFVAVNMHSSLIGFFAVLALLSALGFFVDAFGMTYVLGFRDDKAVPSATFGAFVILFLFVGLRIGGVDVWWLEPFEDGGLFLGSFVGYLGLLIMSSRFYTKTLGGYAIAQITTFALGLSALFIGSIFEIGELQKVGGTFFALYLIEKFLEVPIKNRTSYAAWCTVISGGIVAGCLYVISHPEQFQTWFFLPS